jgi:hypothetical protein
MRRPRPSQKKKPTWYTGGGLSDWLQLSRIARKKAYEAAHPRDTQKVRRAANTVKVAAYQKKYRSDHQEEQATYQKKYTADNADVISAKKKVYYAEHKEEIAQQQKKYEADHTDERRIYNKAYRAKKAREYYIMFGDGLGM